MSDIFLSYSKEDRRLARRLATTLESMGWSVFWDVTIPPGRTWDDHIAGELEEARCVVVGWSRAAVSSEWVREEAREGKRRGTLVPVLWADVEPPFGFRGLQAVDLTSWEGDVGARALQLLVQGIERILGPGRGLRVRVLGTSISDRGEVELVQVPGGSFPMGSQESEEGSCFWEGPQREVNLPAFEIGRYPIINEEYARFLEANPHVEEPFRWNDPSYNDLRKPVVGVSWWDASSFARWAGCWLCSEAAWEYAARAGATAPYLTGAEEEDLDRLAWYAGNSGGGTHRVGEKEPNAWGLCDVLGNVWEWVSDDWHETYEGAPTDGSVWAAEHHLSDGVQRGGAFDYEARFLRVTFRYKVPREARFSNLGFRVAR